MFEKIAEIIADQFGVEVDDIKMETDLVKDLDADSLDVVEVVMALEDLYGIEIPDDDVEEALSVPTIGAVIEYLNGRGVN